MHVGLAVFNDVEWGLDLANTLHEIGLRVTLYLSHKHAAMYMNILDRPKERIYEMGLLPQACDMRLFYLPRMRDPRSLRIIHKIVQTLHEDRVDVVHILMGPGEFWLAILAVLLRDIPVASNMIIPKPNLGDRLPEFVTVNAYKLLAWRSDVVIVNGADQVALVEKLYGIQAMRIAYVPLSPRTIATKWSVQRQAEELGTVLFFGTAAPHKGLELLVRAQPLITRQVPDARILIYSRGEELERCRRMIQDNSKFEIRDGYVSGEVMASLFQRASLVVLPYLSASTSGNLVMAYVFGKPVVATRVGSLPEYVEDGVTGLLVDSGEIRQLADAVVQLLSDDELRHQMGKNALCWVSEQHKKVAVCTLEALKRAITIHNGA